jgi:pyridoxine 5-phosphate synthase
MQFNAGHALNCLNVGPVAALPGLGELHIGHSIVSEAVFVGLRESVARMRACIDRAAAGVHSVA